MSLATSDTAASDAALRLQVERFLFDEAALLDAHDYNAWDALWDSDGDLCYWLPANGGDIDPRVDISIVYDDREHIHARVSRLVNPGVHSQDPPSRLMRMVGNVRLLHGPDSDGLVEADATLLLTEWRRGNQVTYAGRMEYVLRAEGDRLWLRSKKVVLVNNEDGIGSLSYIV